MKRNDDVRAALREAAFALDALTDDDDRGNPSEVKLDGQWVKARTLARRLRGLARRTREVVSEAGGVGCSCRSFRHDTPLCGLGWICRGPSDPDCPLSHGPIVVRRAP